MDFAALLARPVGSAEPPKPIPAGPWYVLISNREFGKSEKKQTPYVRFTLTLQQPGPEVDAQALTAFGDYAGKTIRQDFYLTPESVYRLDQFVQNVLGITGMTLAQALENVIGRGFIAVIAHRADPQDMTRIFAEVKDSIRTP